MIDVDRWLLQLDDSEEQQEKEWKSSQEELFLAYVLRQETPYRKDLKERFAAVIGIGQTQLEVVEVE